MMSRFIFLLFALAGIAFAHPHIFIDATTDVIFNETEFVGVQNSWTFDPIYSQAMFATGDKNGEGKIYYPNEKKWKKGYWKDGKRVRINEK